MKRNLTFLVNVPHIVTELDENPLVTLFTLLYIYLDYEQSNMKIFHNRRKTIKVELTSKNLRIL